MERYIESLGSFYRDATRIEDRILGNYQRPHKDAFKARLDAVIVLALRLDVSTVSAQSRHSAPEEITIHKRDTVVIASALSEAAQGKWTMVKEEIQRIARLNMQNGTAREELGACGEESETEALLWINLASSF